MDLSKEHIEKFLDEFTLMAFKGRDKILACAHYKETFNELVLNQKNKVIKYIRQD